MLSLLVLVKPSTENNWFTNIAILFSVIEKFEELEGRIPGETSGSDLASVQKLRKQLSEAQVV